MSTSARDFDAKRLHPDSAKHAAEALNKLKKSNLLDRLTTPLGEASHMTFARDMANLIVGAADTIDNTITNQEEAPAPEPTHEPTRHTTAYNPFIIKATTLSIALTLILLILLAKYGI